MQGEARPEGIGNLSANWKGEWKKESFFFLEQFNNRKSPGSEPTRTVLLTQPGYVLQLQHARWKQFLDAEALKLRSGIYFIPQG